MADEEDINMTDEKGDDMEFGDEDGWEDEGDEFGDGDGDGDDGWGDTELLDQGDIQITSVLESKTNNDSNNNNVDNDENEKKEAISWKCSEMVDKIDEITGLSKKEECGFHNTKHPMICESCGGINTGIATSIMDENQKKEGIFWSNLYEKVYLTYIANNKNKKKNKNKNNNNNLKYDIKEIRSVFDEIYVHESVSLHTVEFRDKNKSQTLNSCETCLCDFPNMNNNNNNENDCVMRCEDLKCHYNICMECIGRWIVSLIERDIITPYLKCPSKIGESYDDKTNQLIIETCQKAIPISVVFKLVELNYLDIKYLYQFASKFAQLRLGPIKKWVQCPNNKESCKYGILFKPSDDSKKVAVCKACNFKGTYELEHEFDLETQKWIKEGKVRLCPKCELPHMKDKGLCNVMKCGKCGVWWNWRTKETGSTEYELKQIARRNHTLWEPGELEYQQKLQKENLPEFIKLLAKNGIKYNPNYVRGS